MQQLSANFHKPLLVAGDFARAVGPESAFHVSSEII